ncbi:MAG: asparagine synthetase A [Thermoplasmata archaeon]
MELPKPIYEMNDSEIERKKLIGNIGTYVLKFLSDEFINNNFQWIMPVIFSRSTDPLWPDPGASIEKRLETEIYGFNVKVTQSMIVHKIVACSVLYEKLFTFSPNIRIEKRERAATGLHAYEFTQLDFEMRNAESKDVMKFVENLIYKLKESLEKEFGDFVENDLLFNLKKPPWKTYDSENLKIEFGNGWEKILIDLKEPVWLINIPREFYDFQDFETGRWDNYDLYLPGLGEVLSGAKREFVYNKMKEKIIRDDLNEENFKVILDLAKSKRIKQCAGAGIGIERLLKWITNVDHIGMVQLFPRVPGIVYDL